MDDICKKCDKEWHCFTEDLYPCKKLLNWEPLEPEDIQLGYKPRGIGEIGRRLDGSRPVRNKRRK